jgi:hypothetical protein
MLEISELTMVYPGSMSFAGTPSYPWTPDLIENLTEVERRGYLKILRQTREELNKELKKSTKK